jgi:mRNA-degrading endonuclease RelE of RelBE toxin-antitoxin system
MHMYQPIILPHFQKQLKRHTKKYRHLTEAVISILEDFDKRQHVYVGHNIYKVRVQTKDLPKGKSKSFRLIIFIVETEKYLVPICVYFKGTQEDITKKEINDHVEIILFELRTENLL